MLVSFCRFSPTGTDPPGLEGLAKQLEEFVNSFPDKVDEYRDGLIKANEKYSHKILVKSIIEKHRR